MRETLDTIDPRRRESDAPFLAEWCLYRYSASRQHAGDGLGIVSAIGRSEEHTSELQSLMRISYAVFCLKKKNILHTFICFIKITNNYHTISIPHTNTPLRPTHSNTHH